MTLQEFVNEAISSGRTNSSKSRYPKSNSKEDIIEWLEENGYHKVDNHGQSLYNSFDVRRLSKLNDDKIYHLGRYQENGTHWIQFGNSYRLYTIRTGNDFNRGDSMYLDRLTPGHGRTFSKFEDFIDYILKQDPDF